MPVLGSIFVGVAVGAGDMLATCVVPPLVLEAPMSRVRREVLVAVLPYRVDGFSESLS